MIKYGLIIQGPRYTFGDGPNNSRAENGFDSLETVRENIRRLRKRVEFIVVSTWHQSGFAGEDIGSGVSLLESYPISDFDFLNQRKQFLSTFVGASYLNSNTDCTHIIKIRTDQLMPLGLMSWLDDFFLREGAGTKLIVCSELLRNSPFYVGDFFFAGETQQILNFATHVLHYEGRRIAINNSVDYVLKHLVQSNERVAKAFPETDPLRNQFRSQYSSPKMSGLWRSALREYFAVLPEEIYWEIVWRDRSMLDVLGQSGHAFFFHEEWFVYRNQGVAFSGLSNIGNGALHSFWQTYVDLKRYLKSRFRFQFGRL